MYWFPRGRASCCAETGDASGKRKHEGGCGSHRTSLNQRTEQALSNPTTNTRAVPIESINRDGCRAGPASGGYATYVGWGFSPHPQRSDQRTSASAPRRGSGRPELVEGRRGRAERPAPTLGRGKNASCTYISVAMGRVTADRSHATCLLPPGSAPRASAACRVPSASAGVGTAGPAASSHFRPMGPTRPTS